jgi:hypothetical protein
MRTFVVTAVSLLVSLAGCSGNDSSNSGSATGGSSAGGSSSGGASSGGASSGGASSGGSGNTATGGVAGSPAGGSAGSTAGTGGIGPNGPDIENISGQQVTAFPAHLSFQTDDYADVLSLVWTTEGATHQYLPNAGWNGGGAAHFTPSIAEGYSGIGSFLFAPGVTTTHLSMRWLMKIGPTMGQYGYQDKILIFVRNPNDADHHRPMLIAGLDPGHTGAFVAAPCDGTVCQYNVAPNNPEPWWPDGSDTFWLGPTGYAEEWTSWEFEVDAQAGWIRMYITTEDGVFNDTLYAENPMVDSEPGGTFEYIDILGGYFKAGQADAGNWFELDEVVIHNQHIGPPPGFVQ